MSKETMRLALEALENNKRTHYYCEDTWYSCPKHEDGCANEAEGNECNCGADEINAQLDKAITALREALAEQPAQQPAQQEPVTWGVDWGKAGDISCVSIIKRLPDGRIEVVAVEYAPYEYNPPAQRTWVRLTNNELQPIANEYRILFGSWVEDFARAIEAKLKEKNT